MLPDFPDLKAKFNERVVAPRMLAVELGNMGPFAESPRMVIHEHGENTVSELVREDGTIERSSLTRTEVKVEQNLKELENFTPGALVSKLDEVAGEMGKRMFKKNLEKFEATLKTAGRGIDMAGKPLTLDAVLDMLEGTLVSFDEKGEPRMPTMMAHPDVARKLMRLFEEAKDDERLQRRYRQVIQKKKDEWHVREACRKLVG